MTVAVIYVPADQFNDHAYRLVDHCEEVGWDVFGIVTDTWQRAAEIKESGLADVIVVGRSDHIDPRNLPGVEVVAADQNGHGGDRPDRRRPRRLR